MMPAVHVHTHADRRGYHPIGPLHYARDLIGMNEE
jgi:hypothetical protein